MTTLFRTADERSPAPLTVGMAFTPPVQAQEPVNEFDAPFPDAPAAPPFTASPRLSEPPAARQSAPALAAPLTAAGAPPVAAPVVMRATLPAPVAASLPPPTPIATPLSPLPQPVESGNRERISPPPTPLLVQPRSAPGAPTVPAATAASAHQPMSDSGNTPALPPVAPVVTPPVPPLQRTPAAEQPTASAMDDATWARLRAIVRKHQARAATESTQGAAVPPTSVPPTAASAPATTSVQMTPAEPSPMTQMTSTAGQTETSATIPMTRSVATPVAPAVQPGQRQPIEPAPVALGLPATMAPKESPLPQPPPPPTGADAATAPPVVADQLPAVTADDTGDELATDEAEATDWTQPADQAPLQAVWPVQRLTDTGAEAATPTVSELPAYVGPPPPEPPELRRQLSALPTAQPTESSIDLVLPRRPRPVRPGAPTASATPGDTPTVQRQGMPTDAPATTGRPAAVETVATEIGPLPADLWQLIGEKPPQGAPPLAAVNSAPVQRAPAAYSPSMTDEPAASTMAAPPPVTPADDSITADSYRAAVTTAVTSAAPMLSPLTPASQPGQNAAAAEELPLSGVSDSTPMVAMAQMAHQETPPVTNGGALPTAVLPTEAASAGRASSAEKKTRSIREAHPRAKTSRQRRKRVMPP
ncbi:MAG: hypothetical protein DYG89_18025 [Caldilinea sp. CFX5]|nr:hypothetical protein [Caldilinea sp. CFX5]